MQGNKEFMTYRDAGGEIFDLAAEHAGFESDARDAAFLYFVFGWSLTRAARACNITPKRLHKLIIIIKDKMESTD